ncbi:MAG: amino acid/amide transporter rane protein 1, family [Frankiales bacterium]|nr:amino acid/amide transporter rane protein 1, family [Frankiales bacterium]
MSHPVLADSFDVTTQFVTPLVNGLFDGAAYGLLALGLVLLYKSNRIFNFAQGEFATVAGIVAFMGTTGYGFMPKLPYLVACLLAVVCSIVVALLSQLLVIRPMFDRPRVVVVVGTVGIALFLIGLEGAVFPRTGVIEPFTTHFGLSHAPGTIDRVQLPWTGIATLIALVVLALLSFLFFRYSATGTAILAISQDSTAARTVGISVQRISLITWGLAGLLGGVAGVLIAQNKPMVPGAITGLALTGAFAAAVLGGMTSLPGAFLGGVLLGLFQDFVDADYTFVPGLEKVASPHDFMFVVLLLVVLLIRPRGLLGKEA